MYVCMYGDDDNNDDDDDDDDGDDDDDDIHNINLNSSNYMRYLKARHM